MLLLRAALVSLGVVLVLRAVTQHDLARSADVAERTKIDDVPRLPGDDSSRWIELDDGVVLLEAAIPHRDPDGDLELIAPVVSRRQAEARTQSARLVTARALVRLPVSLACAGSPVDSSERTTPSRSRNRWRMMHARGVRGVLLARSEERAPRELRQAFARQGVRLKGETRTLLVTSQPWPRTTTRNVLLGGFAVGLVGLLGPLPIALLRAPWRRRRRRDGEHPSTDGPDGGEDGARDVTPR